MTPIIYTDYYKTEHYRMYPDGTRKIFSNLTPRKSRIEGIDNVVFFGLQHFIKKYLLGKFNTNFFNCTQEIVVDKKPYPVELARYEGETYDVVEKKRVPLSKIIEEYSYAINTPTKHVEDLWKLGYLPLQIQALPEGTKCPIRVPPMTIWNTKPEFYWLTNYLETLSSCQLWQPITSATIAAEYWKILSKYALETTGSTDFVQWQGHDFSMRGMSSLESSILSGMGHLTSFTGTDTIPAIYALRNSYGATGLIGASVPATEHSVMCMGTKDDELGTFSRLLDLYPTGILSVVSDTWSLPKVVCSILPRLKDKIMARDGRLVIRPDSFWTNPEDCICGYDGVHKQMFGMNEEEKSMIRKGLVEALWDLFGGTINEQGYKVLHPSIGCIYGDSISLERAETICKRLKKKGFASTNIVYGIGSYTYQMNTRDTFGFAMKATYGEVLEPSYDKEGNYEGLWSAPREIFKDPITDDGTKKSAKGLIWVEKVGDTLVLRDQATWDDVLSDKNELKTVFKDGQLVRECTLDDIRARIKAA